MAIWINTNTFLFILLIQITRKQNVKLWFLFSSLLTWLMVTNHYP